MKSRGLQILKGLDSSLSYVVIGLQVYSEEEMRSIEGRADEVDSAARAGNLPTQCFHTSQSRNGNLKRTKFFFGARCKPLFVLRGCLEAFECEVCCTF